MEAFTAAGEFILGAAAGAFLSSAFEALFERLKSPDILRFARDGKVLAEITKWEDNLRTIKDDLDIAEERERTESRVKDWVNDLKSLVYDVEDLVDELSTEAQKRKLKMESQPSSSKSQKIVQRFIAGYDTVKFSADVVSKIEKITAEMEEIMKRKHGLGLTEILAKGSTSQLAERLPTTSLVNEAKVCGREEDQKAILELLKPNAEAHDGGISVLAIVGMGGIGKTTLAQLIFNDGNLQFDFRAWVSVGEDFDISKITKMILQSEADEHKDLNSLQQKLKEKLSGKKFLVVLDDVWRKENYDLYDRWTSFYRPFEAGARESRIILTTRDEGVSTLLCTIPHYPLQRLSYEDCLSVFVLHALGARDFNAYLDLQQIGEEIVKRCQGLPLAAKSLGGLLRGKPNRHAWEEVLNSKIWEETSGGILPALKLSYHHLPSHLKRCFAYCTIFPKDYEFHKDELILLWVSEGFLQQWNEGDKCFHDLVLRSFFQQSGGQKSRYVMHDLINDLARYISGDLGFNLDEIKVNKSPSTVRHSAFNRCKYDIAQRFQIFHQMKSLRTFLALPTHGYCQDGVYLSKKVVDELIPKFKCLRVLSIRGYNIDELPDSIGDLKHLRYLNVSSTKIERLPKSIGKLINLQALSLSQCTKLLELPTNLGDLINLRCLDITGTTSLKEMALNIGNLRNLHTLTKFIVGSGEGRGITQLMEVSKLRGMLHIANLQNVKDVHEVERIKIRDGERLENLVFEWTDNFDDSRNKDLQILHSLQPQQNITSLSIMSYGGTMFPSWIGCAMFNKVRSLRLCDCQNITLLPPVGQLPSLRDLWLKGMNWVKNLGLEFYGENLSSLHAFSSLETLDIRDMAEWEHWSWPIGNGDIASTFCELRTLVIKNCPKLVGSLPNHLLSLQQLEINNCPKLEALPKSIPHLGELGVEGCNQVIFRDMPDRLASLTKLRVRNICGLICFSEAFFIPFVVLEHMIIRDCEELKYMWEDGIGLSKLASLKELLIWDCEELVSLVKGEEGNLPCNLQSLTISSCDKLEKLMNFPTTSLPHSLKSIHISYCDSLTCVPKGILVGEEEEMKMTCVLKKLDIRWNISLALAPSDVGNKLLFPSSLVSLLVGGDTMTTILLESLQIRNWLSHLTHLEINGCEELELFVGDMGLLLPTLTSFKLCSCTKLRSLPNHMDNLKKLAICNCPQLASFPEGGFPSTLSSLEIVFCNRLERQQLSEWRLHTLTSLQHLQIMGEMEQLSTFPNDDNNDFQLLPSTLTHLSILGFKSLQSISSSILSLSSLQDLAIWYCPQLQFLPMDGFPPSLESLHIIGCPLLEKKCLKGKGDYWPLIAPIPSMNGLLRSWD